jgi:hypothetical protein
MTRYAGRGGHNAARDIVRRGTHGRTGDTRASNDADKREQLGIKIKNGPTRSIPVIRQPRGKPRGRHTVITKAWI